MSSYHCLDESAQYLIRRIPTDQADLVRRYRAERHLHQNYLARLCQNASIIAGPLFGEGYADATECLHRCTRRLFEY